MQTINAAIPTGGADDPDKVRIYFKPNATDPGAGNFKLQVTDALTARYSTTYDSTGAADGAGTAFPAGTAAIVAPAVTGWQLKGDGSMRASPLQIGVNTDVYLRRSAAKTLTVDSDGAGTTATAIDFLGALLRGFSGAAFPASPSTNDNFFHTTFHRWFMWNGTFWLPQGGSGFYGWYGGGTFASVATGAAVTAALSTTTKQSDTPVETAPFHFTSAANLTGTVSKTSGSKNITGSGTLFTTELSVGQVIAIPGTTTQYFVVATITDNTHLTVRTNANNTASGQTAARKNDVLVCPTGGAGYWRIMVSVGSSAASGTGSQEVWFLKGTDGITMTLYSGSGGQDSSASNTLLTGETEILLADYDMIQIQYVNRTGTTRTPTITFVAMRWVGEG